MIEEQTSTKLTTISLNEDEDLYIYDYWIETLLIGISRKDQVRHNRENIVLLKKVKQYILKDTIDKYVYKLKIPKLLLYMIEYKADPNYSFYRVFKEAEMYLDIFNDKA